MRRMLSAALAICGLLIVCRTAAGPLTYPLRVNSPLNSETAFAVGGLILLLAGSNGQRGRSLSESPGWINWAAGSCVFLAAVAALSRGAGLYFLSDDFLILKHAQAARDHLASIFFAPGGDGFFRPVGYALFGLSSGWAGIDPGRWHWIGFVLHGLNAFLVFRLAAALGRSRFAAVFAGLLFAVHGTRPEAALWLAGRFDLWAAFFVLLSLLAFLRSFDARAWLYRGASLAAMVLAILSKESAYALPLMIVLLAWQKRALRSALPFVVAAACLLGWRWTLFSGWGGYPGATSPGAVAVVKTLALRLWAILFFPVNWSIEPGVWLGALAVAYLGALLWLLQSRIPRGELIVPLSFVVLAALPPVQQLLIGFDLQKARLLYLPSVGFCLLLATAAEYAPARWRWWIAGSVLVFQCAALQHNLNSWDLAAGKARAACVQAAACHQSAIAGLPGSLYGVYFFANGFPECVAMQSAAGSGTCTVRWDAAAANAVTGAPAGARSPSE